jgi:hypothetical protein
MNFVALNNLTINKSDYRRDHRLLPEVLGRRHARGVESAKSPTTEMGKMGEGFV